MAWLDDRIRDHPKFVTLSAEAFRQWAHALCYCSEHATGGRLDAALIALRIPRRYVDELVAGGIWDAEPDGLWVHDWQEYNEKRESTIDEKREQARERQRRHRAKIRGETVTRDSHAKSRVTGRDGKRDSVPGRAPAPPRAQAGPRPNDQDHDQVTPAADVDLDAAPDAAAADHDQEQDQDQDPRLERLRAAGWRSPKQQTAAAEDPDRAIAWLEHAQSDPACHTPGALAWQNYDAGDDWPAEPQSTVATGATGMRSNSKPLEHRCPECDHVFDSLSEREDHIDAAHRTGVGAPPPAELAAALRGQPEDDDPEPQPENKPTHPQPTATIPHEPQPDP